MKKKKWIERQQAILDAARAAGRGLTEEEQAELDALQRKIDEAGDEPEDQGAASGQRSAGGQEPEGVTQGTPAPSNAEEAQQAVVEERKRNSDIVELCRQVGMDPYCSRGAHDPARCSGADGGQRSRAGRFPRRRSGCHADAGRGARRAPGGERGAVPGDEPAGPGH